MSAEQPGGADWPGGCLVVREALNSRGCAEPRGGTFLELLLLSTGAGAGAGAAAAGHGAGSPVSAGGSCSLPEPGEITAPPANTESAR